MNEYLNMISPQFKKEGIRHEFVYYDSGHIFSVCHYDADGHCVGGDVINYFDPAKQPKYEQMTLF